MPSRAPEEAKRYNDAYRKKHRKELCKTTKGSYWKNREKILHVFHKMGRCLSGQGEAKKSLARYMAQSMKWHVLGENVESSTLTCFR